MIIIDTLDVDYYQLAAEYWKKIGVDVEVIVVDRPAWIAAAQGLVYKGMSSTVSSYDFDALEAIRGYHSSSVGKSGTGASTTGLQDPQFDALFDAAQAADNVEEQQRVVREIDLYLAQIHALVWSPKPPQFNVNQSWVKGYNGEIDLGWGDRNAVFSRIWIDQDLKRDMGSDRTEWAKSGAVGQTAYPIRRSSAGRPVGLSRNLRNDPLESGLQATRVLAQRWQEAIVGDLKA